MSQPFKLYRLQQIDSQLDQAYTRLKQIEKILGDDSRMRRALGRAEETDKALQEVRRALKRSEEDVQAQHIKIEQTESTLYGGKVRNPKELQDLQNESAALKRYLAVLEDRQLEKMMALEEAEAEHNQATKELDEVRARVGTQQESLISEQTALQKEVDRLVVMRNAAASSIEPDDLRLYDQLRQQRMGVAVAKVSDKACAACGSTLTPSMIQTAQSPNQITRCTFCGRILYAG